MKKKAQEFLLRANDVLLGKEECLKLAFCSLLSNGHLLLEDTPGVGKTSLAYLIGKLVGLDISRIQFTNDLLPSDIIGTSIYKKNEESFEFMKGPLFGELILADELNRATPKTQSALLQVMEERLVTVDGRDYPLEYPYFIIATQNPQQQIGTYALPESQLDRFFMSLYLGAPSREFEKKIIQGRNARDVLKDLAQVMTKNDLVEMIKEVESVEASDGLLNYLLDLLEKGRSLWDEGGRLSPRAGQNLLKASKAYAFLEGRNYILPDDLQAVAPAVLGHRVAAEEGVKKGHQKIKQLLLEVKAL